MSLSPATALPRGHQTMLLAHRAMLRDLDRVQRTAATLATTTNPARAQALSAYIDRLAFLIHHHHDGEDQYLWPRLAEAGADREALELLASEHSDLADLLTAWHHAARNPALDGASATRLAALTCELRTHLADHAADEERELLDQLAPSLDEKTWKGFENHMRTTAPLWTLRFMPAWLRSVATPDDDRGVPVPLVARIFSGWLERTQQAAFGDDY
ncbi:hemerythrin domain-containing protein [Nocardia sp. NPDC004722]